MKTSFKNLLVSSLVASIALLSFNVSAFAVGGPPGVYTAPTFSGIKVLDNFCIAVGGCSSDASNEGKVLGISGGVLSWVTGGGSGGDSLWALAGNLISSNTSVGGTAVTGVKVNGDLSVTKEGLFRNLFVGTSGTVSTPDQAMDVVRNDLLQYGTTLPNAFTWENVPSGLGLAIAGTLIIPKTGSAFLGKICVPTTSTTVQDCGSAGEVLGVVNVGNDKFLSWLTNTNYWKVSGHILQNVGPEDGVSGINGVAVTTDFNVGGSLNVNGAIKANGTSGASGTITVSGGCTIKVVSGLIVSEGTTCPIY